jgi:gluconolactonase
MRGFVPIMAAALAAALLTAAPAAAVAPCDRTIEPRVLAAGQGTLESVITGAGGRLYFTATPDEEAGRLMVLPRRRSTPRVVNTPIRSPGGLAVDDRGRILVGYGNGLNGVTGTLFPASGLFRVDPRTGARTLFTNGLSMANGIVRSSDGTVYASDDFGTNIDRVRNGRVDHGWIRTLSPNGLVLSRDERYLYWAQTFQPPQISRVDLAEHRRAEVFARGDLGDLTAGLDGMTRDSRDRLFVAANGIGEVWRVDTAGRACMLADGVGRPSAVAFGSGRRGFKRDSLYVVEFGGTVWELRRARAARYPG